MYVLLSLLTACLPRAEQKSSPSERRLSNCMKNADGWGYFTYHKAKDLCQSGKPQNEIDQFFQCVTKTHIRGPLYGLQAIELCNPGKPQNEIDQALECMRKASIHGPLDYYLAWRLCQSGKPQSEIDQILECVTQAEVDSPRYIPKAVELCKSGKPQDEVEKYLQCFSSALDYGRNISSSKYGGRNIFSSEDDAEEFCDRRKHENEIDKEEIEKYVKCVKQAYLGSSFRYVETKMLCLTYTKEAILSYIECLKSSPKTFGGGLPDCASENQTARSITETRTEYYKKRKEEGTHQRSWRGGGTSRGQGTGCSGCC
jgi:hypothetical protein